MPPDQYSDHIVEIIMKYFTKHLIIVTLYMFINLLLLMYIV